MSTIARREREKRMTQVPSEPPQRGMRRLARLLLTASLAAILVIGVLAVISVLLFNRSNQGNAPQPRTPPISITLSHCSSLSWSWQVDLCTHHQFKDLLQWRKMGEYVFVLERAYLDLNQLVMSYRVFSQATGRQTYAELDTVITTSQGQSFRPSAGSVAPYGPAVVQFTTPPVPQQTQTLELNDRRGNDTRHVPWLPRRYLYLLARRRRSQPWWPFARIWRRG